MMTLKNRNIIRIAVGVGLIWKHNLKLNFFHVNFQEVPDKNIATSLGTETSFEVGIFSWVHPREGWLCFLGN